MDGRRRDARAASGAVRRAASVVARAQLARSLHGVPVVCRLLACRLLVRPRLVRLLVACPLLLCPSAIAHADLLPSRPITLWNDRLIISGDATFTIGSKDEGYFNSIDYYHDALNVMRLGLSLEYKLGDRVSVLGQVIDQVALRDAGDVGDSAPWAPFDVNRNVVRPYALFVRLRPWRDRPVTIQAGRIPPVFGAYVRQDSYGTQPLISLPLAYHYSTTLRTDALPQNAIGMSVWRGGGWRSRYRVGSQSWGQGVPLVSALRWDSGVQVQVGGDGPVEVSGAVTNGTLSDPRFDDRNDGKSVSGRLALRPVAGLVAGVSAARGAFFDDAFMATLPDDVRRRSYTQRALGADFEYSRDYWLVRTETVISWWDVPPIDAPFMDSPLRAWGTFVEGRWKLTPRWYVAARWDHLGFSTIDPGPEAGGPVSWDAPVTRAELGGGYSLMRNVRIKASYQYDWRDAGAARRRGAFATQIVYWF